jgi:hypothetical protein
LKSGITFDGNVGFNYYFKGLKVGFSVPQLVQTKVQDLNSNSALDYQMARHYLAMASYEISLANDKFFIDPGAMFRMTKGGEFQVDGFAQFSYKRLAWISVAYRYDYALTVGAGVQLHDRLSLGYATDISMNGLQGYTSGTHEVMLGFKFGKREESGVIEAIQRLEEGQKKNTEQIQQIDERNEGLLDENKSQKELIEEQKEEIAKLTENTPSQTTAYYNQIGDFKRKKSPPTTVSAKKTKKSTGDAAMSQLTASTHEFKGGPLAAEEDDDNDDKEEQEQKMYVYTQYSTELQNDAAESQNDAASAVTRSTGF